MTERYSTILNRCLLLASVAVSLILGEITVRILCPTPNYGFIPQELERNIFRYDAELGWAGIPLIANTYKAKDHIVTVSHDDLGYRNKVKPFDKTKENYIILGDSYVWGAGVEDNATASYVLSTHYKNINAYNIAAPGYGTDQELLALKRFLKSSDKIPYKAVFLVYYCNDIDDVVSNFRYGYNKPVFTMTGDKLELKNIPVPEGMSPIENHSTQFIFDDFHPIISKSQLYNFVAKRALPSIFKLFFDYYQNTEFNDSDNEKPRSEFPVQLAIIKEIQKTAKAHDIYLHVVFLITKNTTKTQNDEMITLSGLSQTSGIESSTFYSTYIPSTDLWYDGHLSPYGQKKLAEHIYNTIEVNSGASGK